MIAHWTNIQQRIMVFFLLFTLGSHFSLFFCLTLFLCLSLRFSRCCCNVRFIDREAWISRFAVCLCVHVFSSFQFSLDAIEALNALGASLADYHLYLAMRFPLVLYKLNFIAVFVFSLRSMWLWWFLLFVCGFILLVTIAILIGVINELLIQNLRNTFTSHYFFIFSSNNKTWSSWGIRINDDTSINVVLHFSYIIITKVFFYHISAWRWQNLFLVFKFEHFS